MFINIKISVFFVLISNSNSLVHYALKAVIFTVSQIPNKLIKKIIYRNVQIHVASANNIANKRRQG